MDVGNTKQSAERVFFIVDRTRLKEETDELKNAIVVYVPEVELQKVRIWCTTKIICYEYC